MTDAEMMGMGTTMATVGLTRVRRKWKHSRPLWPEEENARTGNGGNGQNHAHCGPRTRMMEMDTVLATVAQETRMTEMDKTLATVVLGQDENAITGNNGNGHNLGHCGPRKRIPQ